MEQDMCVPCGGGLVNLRVGAIIERDGKLLMVGNDRSSYLYSVGGRIRMGETAAEAVVREVWEETGAWMTVDRLAFVHENYFYGDAPSNKDKLIYEISFYFYMNVPNDFSPTCGSFTDDEQIERLVWVSPDTPQTIYPSLFRTELHRDGKDVRYFLTDERKR